MARLHEYQGKAILKEYGVAVPDGGVARTPEEARQIAEKLGGRLVLKVQAWITGRAAKGGVKFADSPDEAAVYAEALLGLKFGNFPVEEILIERAIAIKDEIFVSLTIDDASQAPLLLLDFQGGTGIEDRAASVARLPVDVETGVDPSKIRDLLVASPIDSSFHEEVIAAIDTAIKVAREKEARSLEINPLVTTSDGIPASVVAADCRMTIDDYAVFRHDELGIDIARELDHPPTKLERIAYEIEQNDHRGTFYFAKLPTEGAEHSGGGGIIGFHGAGGGGSMMSMDAVTNAGFTLANFCDTSGNPSAAKVYRAARIILSQPGLVGYFGSGSGVASQEQFWSAYGLSKAFIEMNMNVPVVIRLGGNSEDRAVEILEDACSNLPATIKGFRKDDTPAYCAEIFQELVNNNRGTVFEFNRNLPDFVGNDNSYRFPITGGSVWIDHKSCDAETSRLVVEQSAELLKLDESGKPVLAVSEEEIANKDSELIAGEIECLRAGIPVLFVDLAI